MSIDPAAVDPDDVEMLEDLVLAALHDAAAQAHPRPPSHGRPRLAGSGSARADASGRVRLHGPGPGPHRRARPAARRRAQVGPAHRLPPAQAAQAGRRCGWPAPSPRSRTASAFCTRCFNIAEGALCGICTDDRRDATVICVVEEPRDIVAVEKTGEFKGRYHVLQGAISPHRGHRARPAAGQGAARPPRREGVTEIILCTNPNIEGEATAMYLGRLLKPARRSTSPASPAACPSAATSSTPTSSPSAVPSRAAAPSTPESSAQVRTYFVHFCTLDAVR